MFRCQIIAWSLLLWSMIFTFSILTYLDIKPIYRTIPLAALAASLLILTSLVVHAAKETKSLLVFSGWCFLTLAGILLRTTGYIIDWHLNLLITIFTVSAAFAWCVTGHIDNVTEPGLYWYVWSVLFLFAVLCAFNNNSEMAIIIYTGNTGLLATAHLLYIRHILKFITTGPQRCRLLFRVMSCFVIAIALMVGSICYKTDEIDSRQWEQWVIATEILLLIALIIDGILGFTQNGFTKNGINNAYEPVSANDVL